MKKLKKILLTVLLSSSIFLFSGCNSLKTAINTVMEPFSSTTTLPSEIVVNLVGTIHKKDSLLSSYLFTSENSEIFTLNTTHKFSKDLSDYNNKKVVITGIVSNFLENEPSGTITFTKNIKLIDIIQFTEDKNSWNIFNPQYFTLSFSHPLENFTIKEKIVTVVDDINTVSRIITEYNDDIFFTITKNINTGWQQKFINQGVKIKLGKHEAYRIFSGKQILFYIPYFDIQIDYWGEKKDLHLFYTIIKTLQLQKKEGEKGVEKADEKEEGKIETEENISVSSIDKPSISIIIQSIVQDPSLYLENTEEYTDRILINKIEYFGNFLSVEYEILGTDPNESVLKAEKKKKLFFVEWQSIFYEKIYLQELVEWKQGSEYLWEIVNGNTPNIGIYNTYFLRNIATKYISKIPEDFLILLSPSYKYSITYPKKMYYDIYTDNDNIEGVKWSNSPFTTQESKSAKFDITLQLISGKQSEYTELFSKNTIIIPKSSSAYFILTGQENIKFALLQKMAKSITLY